MFWSRADQINELTFEFNQMEGTLPSELGQLTKLRMLNFHHNRVSGSVPAQLTNLTAKVIAGVKFALSFS